MNAPNDQLLRFLVRHWLVGAGATPVVVGALLAVDLGGIRGLVMGAQQPILPITMLLFGFLVTLTSASMGAALMSLGDDRMPKGPRRGLLAVEPELVPIPVRAQRRP